jgi:hypothetical protein
MKIENKLALVWRDDETYLAYPLDKVSINLYKKLSKMFGSPIGRTEPFINGRPKNTGRSI